jgi:hypothetical protein
MTMTDDEIDRRIASLFARMNRLGAKMSGSDRKSELSAQQLRAMPHLESLLDELEETIGKVERTLLEGTDPAGQA